MSRQSEAVKRWRKKTKERLIQAFGGKCGICSYDRCQDALEFHHLDPNEKEFGLGAIRAEPKKWPTIVEEIRKCVLLCANCHREVHAEISAIPENIARFNEQYNDYKAMERSAGMDECPVCFKPKSTRRHTCSKRCSASRKGKVDWSKYDIVELKKTMTFNQIGALVGCSDVAAHKRFKKLMLAG